MRKIKKSIFAITVCLLCTLGFAGEVRAQDTGVYTPYYKAVVSPYRVKDSQDTLRTGFVMCEALRYDPTDTTDYYVKTLLYQNAADDLGDKLRGEIEYQSSADLTATKARFETSDKKTYAFGDLNEVYLLNDGAEFVVATVEPPHTPQDRLIKATGFIEFSKVGKKPIVANDGLTTVVQVLCDHPGTNRPDSKLLLDKNVAYKLRDKF